MKLVIVGGVAGGMSAATRARRLSETAEIVVFEGGNYVSFANCGLPYHVAGEIADRDALILHTPETLAARANLDVRLGWTVTSVDAAAKTVTALGPDGSTVVESYDALLLSPGALSVVPPLPGIDHPAIHTLRTIDEMDALMSTVDSAMAASSLAGRKAKAIVLGAGFIGLEGAEALIHRGLEVTVVEASPHVLPPLDKDLAGYVSGALRERGATVLEGVAISSFAEGDAASGCALRATLSDGSVLDADFVLMSVGAKPNNALAVDLGLDMDERGNILVDASQRTSIEDIYAVGDAVAVSFADGRHGAVQLAGPANRQGRRAADVIFGHAPVAVKPVLATAVVRVFDQVAAITGAGRRTLDAAGVDYETVRIHAGSHAGYYPGAETMHLMAFFDRASGKLLGAAGVGADGVDKRIDVLATAIRAGFGAEDLAELELCYSPPIGSAKDPINMLGFTAMNVLSGLSPQWQPEELAGLLERGAFIVDARMPGAFAKGHIPRAINIPMEDVRAGIEEIRAQAAARGAGTADNPIYVHCTTGVRSYLTVRTLLQAGLEARNLAGGYTSLKPYL
ncbi:MAG: FAD-dependent oxidoreductase [Actinomycetaceae bacterium]|nr:FAD-dependent oxidoreductase [Actinomycetaceae bacterium]